MALHMALDSKKSIDRWDAADAIKLGMSLLIVMIHTAPFGDEIQELIDPLYRIAVPIFFLITSTLFFLRGGGSRSYPIAFSAWRHTAKRIVRLYFFWFIVVFPVTFYFRQHWFAEGLLAYAAHWVMSILFGSTFGGSWYLMATCIGLFVVIVLRTQFNFSNRALIVVSVVSYVFCLLATTYAWVPGRGWMDFWLSIDNWWIPVNSFPIAVAWIGVGSVIADGLQSLPDSFMDVKTKRVSGFIAFVGLLALLVEGFFIRAMGAGELTEGALVLLPVPVIAIFLLLVNSRVRYKHAVTMRRASTVIFCLHTSVDDVLGSLSRNLQIPYLPLNNPFVSFLIVLGVCLVAFKILSLLSSRKRLGWLKIAW